MLRKTLRTYPRSPQVPMFYRQSACGCHRSCKAALRHALWGDAVYSEIARELRHRYSFVQTGSRGAVVRTTSYVFHIRCEIALGRVRSQNPMSWGAEANGPVVRSGPEA